MLMSTADCRQRMGKITIYRQSTVIDRRWLRLLHNAFLICSIVAFISAMAIVFAMLIAHHMDDFSQLLGSFAIIMPVLAVAALSLAAVLDLEARKHTYQEMVEFLEQQLEYLNSAETEPEFARLLLETESRILGETANWYSRRSFTGVA
jgi:hypothetical protein